jgi:uncharacterized protein DUF4383
VYLVLVIYGLVVEHDSSANFVSVNDADNWLQLGVAVAMIALGAALGGRRDDTGNPWAPVAGHRTAHQTARSASSRNNEVCRSPARGQAN